MCGGPRDTMRWFNGCLVQSPNGWLIQLPGCRAARDHNQSLGCLVICMLYLSDWCLHLPTGFDSDSPCCRVTSLSGYYVYRLGVHTYFGYLVAWLPLCLVTSLSGYRIVWLLFMSACLVFAPTERIRFRFTLVTLSAGYIFVCLPLFLVTSLSGYLVDWLLFLSAFLVSTPLLKGSDSDSLWLPCCRVTSFWLLWWSLLFLHQGKCEGILSRVTIGYPPLSLRHRMLSFCRRTRDDSIFLHMKTIFLNNSSGRQLSLLSEAQIVLSKYLNLL